MNNKLLSAVAIIFLFTAIFTLFITVVNAKGFNLLCLNTPNILVTLKDEAKLDAAKDKISKIPQIKITNIKSREEEWSKMVNKYDLPKMGNPFKNEFAIKTKKDADINEIFNKIKEMDFVEKVEYLSDSKCIENKK